MKATTTTILVMEDALDGSTILHEEPKEDRVAHTSETNEGSNESDSMSKLELMVLGSNETKQESLNSASED